MVPSVQTHSGLKGVAEGATITVFGQRRQPFHPPHGKEFSIPMTPPMTTLDDPPLTTDTLPPLDDQPWEAISPRYKTVLRLRLLMVGLVLALAPWIPVVIVGHPASVWHILLSGTVLLVLALLVFVWVPRKVRRTQYLLRRLDVNVRSGYWWYATQSAAINRIQHLEITQGPLERLCGLSLLILYTAGGQQSDLKIPGLEHELAHRIKAHLTERITEEEPPHGPDH